MSDTAEIKHRIKSVSDTHQITKAMELISVSKMRKAIEKQAVNKAYFDSVRYTIKDIMRHSSDIRHKYLVHRPNNRTAYIVIAGDKGLAGAFNNNVLNLAWQHMQSRPVHYVVTIGQMARAFFESKGQPIDLEFTHAVTNPTLHDARGIMRDILDLYDRNLMDEVVVVYTRMESTVSQKPELVRLLPILESDIPSQGESTFTGEILYDPSPKEVLSVLVPQYLVGMIYLYGLAGVKHSYVAQKWLTLAAQAGQKAAQEQLAFFYKDDLTPLYNPIDSYYWFSVIIADHPEYRENMQNLEMILRTRGLLATTQSMPKPVEKRYKGVNFNSLFPLR